MGSNPIPRPIPWAVMPVRVRVSFPGLIKNFMTINDKILSAVDKGYQVDEQGNVWYNNNLRKLTNDTKGYLEFSIRCEGIKRPQNVPVHRLQAYQKFGDKIFEKGIVVRHLDGNPHNNSITNISIGTHQENMMDIPKEQRIAHAKHAASYGIKFNADEVKEYYNKCHSYKETMDKFNIPSKGTLHNIIHKR